jgi:acyl carrier protein
MKKNEIVNELLTFVGTLARKDMQGKIGEQTMILSEHYVDSLGVIQLVTFIESKFNIKMEEADLNLDNLDSVERIANYIEAKKG